MFVASHYTVEKSLHFGTKSCLVLSRSIPQHGLLKILVDQGIVSKANLPYLSEYFPDLELCPRAGPHLYKPSQGSMVGGEDNRRGQSLGQHSTQCRRHPLLLVKGQ